MPLHADWKPLYDGFTDFYCDGSSSDPSLRGDPCPKAEGLFYAYCAEHGIDHSKPRSRAAEAFLWLGYLVPEVREGRCIVRGRAIHPCKTYHPHEWPDVRIYLEEELRASAPTLSGKPLLLDHGVVLDPPNRVLRSAWEDGAVEYVAEVSGDIFESVRSGEIKHVSVEYDWRVLERLDGIAPRGLQLTGLSLLRRMRPGDPTATVDVWEGVVHKLMEMSKLSGQSVRDELYQEQRERAKKYGIQPKQGGHLSKPAEFEKVPEEQFADPVNWRYPIDATHCDAALKYFNRPENRAEYSHAEQVKILTKIVQAALENDGEVAYQAYDLVYRDLPESLKAELEGYDEKADGHESLKAELADAQNRIRVLVQKIDALKAKGSLGEAVLEPVAASTIPPGYVKASEILAFLPKEVPFRWGAGPHEMVRRLRKKCEPAAQR